MGPIYLIGNFLRSDDVRIMIFSLFIQEKNVIFKKHTLKTLLSWSSLLGPFASPPSCFWDNQDKSVSINLSTSINSILLITLVQTTLHCCTTCSQSQCPPTSHPSALRVNSTERLHIQPLIYIQRMLCEWLQSLSNYNLIYFYYFEIRGQSDAGRCTCQTRCSALVE
jgi:hypothetical protein